MTDVTEIKRRTAHALRLAGTQPWLIGYDANGIQELITASSRPIAMFGASATIARFDESSRRDGTIFAGGGRGVELVASEDAAKDRSAHFIAAFREQTCGGVMATAYVRFDASAPAESLRWLRHKLDIAKDEAVSPTGSIPVSKNEQCFDCGVFKARHRSSRPDWQGEMVCDRCSEMVRAGRARSREIDERIQSLADLSPSTRRVAAVSVDGNDLGDFFASLGSLEDMAVASEAVRHVFRKANDDTLQGLRCPKVSLATGGDDIRLFLPWEYLLEYVGALVPAIEREADSLSRLGNPLARLAGLGIGIGAVVADARLRASRLMGYAHDLERSAKRLCRPVGQPTHKMKRVRSAFDFAVLTAGEGSFHGTESRAPSDDRPIDMGGDTWPRILLSAQALAKVPGAQRAILADLHTMSEEEAASALRYQVARSRPWQEWYKVCGVNWRDSAAVWNNRPGSTHTDLVRVLPTKSL